MRPISGEWKSDKPEPFRHKCLAVGTWGRERRRGYRQKPDWVGQLQPEKEGAPRVNVSGDSGKSGRNSRPVCLSRKEQPIKGLDMKGKSCS